MTVEPPAPTADSAHAPTVDTMAARMIDTWFPCREVDRAVKTPAGSGLSEKALFTWFASRPIAQARAAVLCSLLPDSPENRADVRAAVEFGDPSATDRLRTRIAEQYGSKPPVVLDVFSGRGIIPLEAARLGVTAIGTDLSPVATLAGRLLADYPLRDWSQEPALPYRSISSDEEISDEAADIDGTEDTLFGSAASEPKLLHDVSLVLAEVGRRVVSGVAQMYPGNTDRDGALPWAYLWAVTIPCDACKRRFPLIGSMALRHPYLKTDDAGQAMRLVTSGDDWHTEVTSGVPTQAPTFASPDGRRGKSGRCPFVGCGSVHSLDVVKAKGFAGQYADALLAVAEPELGSTRKIFRAPRPDEVSAATSMPQTGTISGSHHSVIPDEAIPAGNVGVVYGRGYGYMTYGSADEQPPGEPVRSHRTRDHGHPRRAGRDRLG